jgi:hypothetical protein
MKKIVAPAGLLKMTALLLILFTGCLKESQYRYETSQLGTIDYLDITDANSLFITKGAKSEPGASLYKITADGVLELIRYYRVDTFITDTQDGREIRKDSVELTNLIFPVQMIDLFSGFMIASFRADQNSDDFNFLVQKSTGQAYQLPGYTPVINENESAYLSVFQNEKRNIQQDNNGVMFYLGQKLIHRLDVNALTLNILDYPPTVINFLMNRNGNMILTSGGDTGSSTSSVVRLNNGKIIDPQRNIAMNWLGTDDRFYFQEINEEGLPMIMGLRFVNDSVCFDNIGTINHPDLANRSLQNGHLFTMDLLKKVIVIAEGRAGNMIVIEVYNETLTPKAFHISELGLENIKQGVNSDRYYYLSGTSAGKNVLVKVDPNAYPHTKSAFIPIGDLEIIDMTVSRNDVITYHGKLQGIDVIGEISPDGAITGFDSVGNIVYQIVDLQ